MRDGVTNEFRLVPRDQAVVSVFDSNFLVGDGIWVRRPTLYETHVLWLEGIADERCIQI
jgi:hypothetical protein